MAASRRTACRSCGYTDLHPVLSLGHTPLANALLTQQQLGQPEETYPLDLVLCSRCSLVQITETVPAEKLFRDYLYLSSVSDTVLRHAREIAERVVRARHLRSDSLVIEVASNDGYLLQYYQKAGVQVLGIEPAAKIAQLAVQRGIPTVCDFFDDTLAECLVDEGLRPDVIHAHNVLAHVPELNDFLAGLRRLMKQDGLLVLEVPYVREMIDGCEFDTIYHEHLGYFSLTALNHLFGRHGLTIQHVERVPTHGGTLRVHAGHETAQDLSVSRLLCEEQHWGVADVRFYAGFGARVERLRDGLVMLLRQLKAEGKRIAVYGASAKSTTLLHFCGLGRETLEYVVDRSTLKQGRYTPGTHLPIYPTARLLADMPDYVLLLTWNFADEILEQQAEYRARGGRFIVPVPSVNIL